MSRKTITFPEIVLHKKFGSNGLLSHRLAAQAGEIEQVFNQMTHLRSVVLHKLQITPRFRYELRRVFLYQDAREAIYCP